MLTLNAILHISEEPPLDWNRTIYQYTPKLIGQHLGSEITYLALARYQLMAHPTNPLRMGNILCVLNSLDRLVNHSVLISVFFDENMYAVVNFINKILNPYNSTILSRNNLFPTSNKCTVLN